MTHKIGVSAMLMLLGTASACTDSMMGSDRMDDEIAAGMQENDRHRDAVGAAQTIEDIPAEMARHDAAMDDMMGGMDDAMAGMTHCAGPGMGRITGMHDDMGMEMDTHAEAMSGMADMGAARTEVERHAMVMEGMLEGMHDALGDASCD